MSSHADTIRFALMGAPPPTTYRMQQHDALRSLDALLAENEAQALKLEAETQMRDHARSERDALLAENQRYEKALERIGAWPPEELTNDEVVKRYVECGRLAREALAGDAE